METRKSLIAKGIKPPGAFVPEIDSAATNRTDTSQCIELALHLGLISEAELDAVAIASAGQAFAEIALPSGLRITRI